jgi:hypothetical protein
MKLRYIRPHPPSYPYISHHCVLLAANNAQSVVKLWLVVRCFLHNGAKEEQALHVLLLERAGIELDIFTLQAQSEHMRACKHLRKVRL